MQIKDIDYQIVIGLLFFANFVLLPNTFSL